MKDDLGQECVKGRFVSFQGKIKIAKRSIEIETIAPDFPGKITVFQF